MRLSPPSAEMALLVAYALPGANLQRLRLGDAGAVVEQSGDQLQPTLGAVEHAAGAVVEAAALQVEVAGPAVQAAALVVQRAADTQPVVTLGLERALAVVQAAGLHLEGAGLAEDQAVLLVAQGAAAQAQAHVGLAGEGAGGAVVEAAGADLQQPLADQLAAAVVDAGAAQQQVAAAGQARRAGVDQGAAEDGVEPAWLINWPSLLSRLAPLSSRLPPLIRPPALFSSVSSRSKLSARCAETRPPWPLSSFPAMLRVTSLSPETMPWALSRLAASIRCAPC